jgi:hypothetical protein
MAARSQRHIREVRGRDSAGDWAAAPGKADPAGDVAPGAAGTNITLTPATVAGSVAIGTTVGTLAVVGGNAPPYTYLLPSNPGNLFSVAGNLLKTNVAPVIAAGAKPITVRVQDGLFRIYDKALTVTVT